MKRYLFDLLVWLDEGVNTLAGGDPHRTVSYRLAKAREAGKWWGVYG